MTHLPSRFAASLLVAAAFASVPAFASSSSAVPQCGDDKGKGDSKDGTKDGKSGDNKDGTKDGKSGETKPKAPSAR